MLPAALRVAILHEDGLYGQSVSASQEAQLGARGLRVVEKLGYAARGGDLLAAVQRLKEAAPDVVLHTGYQNDIIVFYRAMREAGWRPRMVIGSGAGYSGVEAGIDPGDVLGMNALGPGPKRHPRGLAGAAEQILPLAVPDQIVGRRRPRPDGVAGRFEEPFGCRPQVHQRVGVVQ